MYQKKAPCTIGLVAANVAIFLVLSAQGATEDAGFMLEHGAMYGPDVLYAGKYYELITCMFLHFGFEHLMNNMISLVLLGGQLEQEIGKVKYLLIYFLSGLGGSLLSLEMERRTADYAVSAGASGAIFGIIGALFYIAIWNRGRIGNVSGKGLLFLAAITLYHGMTSGGINNEAHLGGLIAGAWLAVLLYHRKKGKEAVS